MNIARGGEQTGMAGDPAHGVSVIIVYFAAEDLLAPRAVLRWRDHLLNRLDAPGSELSEVDKGSGAESERLKDSFLAIAIQGPAANFLNHFPQKHKTEIAVETLLTR